MTEPDSTVDRGRRRLLIILIGSVFVVTVLLTTWAVIAGPGDGGDDADAPEGPSGWAEASTPDPSDPGSGGSVEGCPEGTLVASAGALQVALGAVDPGEVIVLAPGRYVGNFVLDRSGTADRPITLCGTADSVLDGGDVEGGYVVHLDGASYWRLSGFTVTNGQKGVMADGMVGSLIDGLTVTHIGDEGIHLRRMSTDNVVRNNKVSDTGLRRDKFGEGIYIGSAESNWNDITGGEPDTSDRNIVEGNIITATTAESIDVKEGTSDGIVRGNTFDGSAMTEDGADSWVDIKGNGWLIEGNTGFNSLLDGFQTHEIIDGWGTRNVFRGNTANVHGPGFGFSLTPARDNVVTCDNKASAAGEGLTNVTCSG
jgi:hypothetical protein